MIPAAKSLVRRKRCHRSAPTHSYATRCGELNKREMMLVFSYSDNNVSWQRLGASLPKRRQIDRSGPWRSWGLSLAC